MNKIKKYIVIGEKRNGRFHKSEEFELLDCEKYFDKIITTVAMSFKNNWFQKLFHLKSKSESYADGFKYGMRYALANVKDTIYDIINEDKPGKKIKRGK